VTLSKRLDRFGLRGQAVDRQEFDEYPAACKKVQQTVAYLELEKGIAEKQAALRCRPNYKELDSREDHARLKQLKPKAKHGR
jgi:hypothetical protein